MYYGILITVILLMYEGVASATMELLNCVELNVDNHKLHLYRAGYIKCYTIWQYFLFGVLGFIIIPFPLFLIPIRIIARKIPGHISHELLNILEGSYTDNCLWWESIFMFRRLVLVTIFTFIRDPIWKSLSLFLGCFVILVSHNYFKPFKQKTAQKVETAFLLNLVLISALQIPQATFSLLGEVFNSTTATVLMWIEGTLAILPLIYTAYIVIIEEGNNIWKWIVGKCKNFKID